MQQWIVKKEKKRIYFDTFLHLNGESFYILLLQILIYRGLYFYYTKLFLRISNYKLLLY